MMNEGLRAEIQSLSPTTAASVRDEYYKLAEGVTGLRMALGNERLVYGTELYNEKQKLDAMAAILDLIELGAVV